MTSASQWNDAWEWIRGSTSPAVAVAPSFSADYLGAVLLLAVSIVVAIGVVVILGYAFKWLGRVAIFLTGHLLLFTLFRVIESIVSRYELVQVVARMIVARLPILGDALKGYTSGGGGGDRDILS